MNTAGFRSAAVLLLFCFGVLFSPVSAGSVVVQDGQLNATGNFYVGAGALFVNSTSGFVGIGTTSPQQKLVVRGNLTVGHEWDGATTTAPVYFGKPASGGGFGAGSAFMTFVDAGSGAGVNYGTSIAFTPHQGGSAQVEAMRIAGNGNVGIGVSSPIVKLDVNGSLRVSPDPWNNSIIYFGNASGSMKWHLVRLDYDGSLRVTESGIADRVTIQNGTGNVGIGTTSPGMKLDVVGPSRAYTDVTAAAASFHIAEGSTFMLNYYADPPASITRLWGTTSWHWLTAKVTVYIAESSATYRKVGEFIVFRNTQVLATILNEGSTFEWTTTPSSGKFGLAFREAPGNGPAGDDIHTDFVVYDNTGQTLSKVNVLITILGTA
ncbi:MAG: hypothetical protein WCX64_04655 [Candidatus Micrarchaeia archaeon]|jgi:hypothetical protein